MKRLLTLVLLGGMLAAGMKVAAPASAVPLAQVVSIIRDANGYYVRAGASLKGADCSGLVSVAQTLATGQPVGRLGSTRTLMAGQWPHAIAGAVPGDLFVIGGNNSHMVAQVLGVNIEASTSGQPFRIGADAKSPWTPGYRQWHLDPAVLAV